MSMNLFVLDKEFNILGFVDDYESLVWRPKYYSHGTFNIQTTISYIDLFSKGSYLFRNDSLYTGVIDDIEINDNSLFVNGRFMESLLDNRICQERKTYTGTVEKALHDIVKDSCINKKPIYNLVDTKHNNRGEYISTAIFGKSIGEALYDLGETHNISYRLRLDMTDKNIYFETYQGLDRSELQKENQRISFSVDMENVISENYSTNFNFYNTAHVYGAGEDSNRVHVIVTNRESDEELKEIYVDARDLQPNEDSGETINSQSYLDKLKERGKEKLEERGRRESIDSEILLSEDISLGDIVSYKVKGISETFYIQITEIIETHEPNNITKRAIFGKLGDGISQGR